MYFIGNYEELYYFFLNVYKNTIYMAKIIITLFLSNAKN